LISRVILR